MDETDRQWAIGELAEAVGVSVRTLHHYDQIGLLVASERSGGGHRRYTGTEVERLYRILLLRQLAFPLAEIAALLESDHESLEQATRVQLERVERQQADIERLRCRLAAILEAMEHSAQPSKEQLLDAMEAMRMTVRLTRIYTRRGDSGQTQLGDMTRVSKTDPRVEACGDVDELNAQIGLAVATAELPPGYREWLKRIQNELFDLGADLSFPAGSECGPRPPGIGDRRVRWLEERCGEVNTALEALDSFVLPGGSPSAAHLHVCRTVCRRAERRVLAVGGVSPQIVRYLNRLSDLLFILSRAANTESEVLWVPALAAT